jgi:hypothetical protein
MGREVRRVPVDWQHPKDECGRYKALYDGAGYEDAVREWDESAAKWARGEFPDYASDESRKLTYVEWSGERPDVAEYMPRWTAAEATHLMMYETTSEGTPISPAFSTPEELARWLCANRASALGSSTASYEGWLRVARGGYACSAVYAPSTGIVSGVDGLT